jgi:hypothetical protein
MRSCGLTPEFSGRPPALWHTSGALTGGSAPRADNEMTRLRCGITVRCNCLFCGSTTIEHSRDERFLCFPVLHHRLALELPLQIIVLLAPRF